ncbi:MAG: hypothetical protein FWE53_01300 [Firmicutes bacterium]|nr:hypothetical protein [Bacillota bacterium]
MSANAHKTYHDGTMVAALAGGKCVVTLTKIQDYSGNNVVSLNRVLARVKNDFAGFSYVEVNAKGTSLAFDELLVDSPVELKSLTINAENFLYRGTDNAGGTLLKLDDLKINCSKQLTFKDNTHLSIANTGTFEAGGLIAIGKDALSKMDNKDAVLTFDAPYIMTCQNTLSLNKLAKLEVGGADCKCLLYHVESLIPSSTTEAGTKQSIMQARFFDKKPENSYMTTRAGYACMADDAAELTSLFKETKGNGEAIAARMHPTISNMFKDELNEKMLGVGVKKKENAANTSASQIKDCAMAR